MKYNEFMEKMQKDKHGYELAYIVKMMLESENTEPNESNIKVAILSVLQSRIEDDKDIEIEKIMLIAMDVLLEKMAKDIMEDVKKVELKEKDKQIANFFGFLAEKILNDILK